MVEISDIENLVWWFLKTNNFQTFDWFDPVLFFFFSFGTPLGTNVSMNLFINVSHFGREQNVILLKQILAVMFTRFRAFYSRVLSQNTRLFSNKLCSGGATVSRFEDSTLRRLPIEATLLSFPSQSLASTSHSIRAK